MDSTDVACMEYVQLEYPYSVSAAHAACFSNICNRTRSPLLQNMLFLQYTPPSDTINTQYHV